MKITVDWDDFDQHCVNEVECDPENCDWVPEESRSFVAEFNR